ncbi:MAG: cation:proton antiporter [Phycisphaeraceae bacterium]|nr:cation:proton antiporter [Phycisphaeraceae bacterium]
MKHDLIVLASAQETSNSVLVALVVILVAAALLAMLMTRLRQATIPGYLLAGAIIGPNALGLISDSESIESISHLATILLMFSIGLHMELSQNRRDLIPATLVGMISTLLSAIGIALVCWLLGLSPPAAITIGLAMSMSSTAVVARILTERRELRQLAGRISFTILLVQDIFAVGILAAIPMLAAWARRAEGASDAHAAPGSLLTTIGEGSLKVGLVIAFLLFGKFILPRIMREAARVAKGEVMLVVSGAVALSAAAVATLAGLSAELGAFVAGLLLASTPFRHQIVGQLEPVRDLFLAIFFASVGLQVDLHAISQLWWQITIGILALITLKALSIGLISWSVGAPPAIASTVGLSLSQAGEFALVVLTVALADAVIDDQAMRVALPIVVLSLVCTPWLMAAARRFSPRLAPAPLAPWRIAASLRADTPDPHPDFMAAVTCRAVIAGFGPVGRAVADRLDLLAIPYTIIELNAETVERQRALGRSIVYGDATNTEVLQAVRIEDASVVVLAIPDDEATIRACRAIRAKAPDAFIAARSNLVRKGIAIREAGASVVAVDEIAVAESLTREVVAHIEKLAEPAPERTGDPVTPVNP